MAKVRKTAIRSNKDEGEKRVQDPLDRFGAEETVPVRFSFAHQATFIPRRARNPLTELFLGHDYAVVRRPRSGVEVAFRITFPYRNRDYQKDFDILAYDDAFWWPLVMLCWEWEGHLSEQDCLKELESGNWNLLSTFASVIGDTTRPRPDRKLEDLAGARILSASSRETVARRAKTLAQDNFLFFAGKTWIRGGEPLYLNSSHWTYNAVAANPGPDRTPRPWTDWPNDPPGEYAFAQRAIRAGQFLTADRYDEADAIAKAHSTRSPRIEVMMPDMLKLVAARARLDAIFRLALRFSAWAQKSLGSALDGHLFVITESIIDVADEEGDDPSLDNTRLRALRPLHDYIEENGLPERPIDFDMLRWDLRNFWSEETRFIAKTFKHVRLSPVDDDALGRLGGLD